MKGYLRVLLLEDSETDAEIIKRLLLKEKMNCVFNRTDTRTEFAQALNSFLPDVILCDHSLPHFDSSEALDMVRGRLLDIPFIMVTGTVSEEYAAGIIRQGADDYILKDRLTRLPSAIEAALKKRKALKEIADYKYALDKSAIVATTDQTGLIIYANENFCRISKYASEELIGQDHRIINSGHHPKSYITDLWKTIATGKVWYGEFCNRAKDGSLYWVDTTIIPFLDHKGKPYQYLSIRIDITEKKKGEQDLKIAHERLNFHIENAPLGFIEWDNELHVKKWSIQAEKIFGWTEKEFISLQKNGYSLVYEDDLPWVSKIGEQLLFGRIQQNSIQHRNYTKKGKVIWCEWFNSVLKDKDGKVITILSLVQDITERKNADEELRQNEIRLNEAQAVAHISSWELDMVNNTTTWSDEFYRIFGVNKFEVKSSTELFLSFIHPEDAGSAKKNVREAFNSFKDSAFSFRFIRKDGEVRYGYSKFKFELDKKGKPARVFGIIHDVTESKKAEEELKLSEMRLREAQAIGHISNWEIDLVRGIHTWSDEYYRIFGLKKGKEQPSLELFLSLIHPDDVDFARKSIDEAFESFVNSSFDFRFIRNDGLIRYGYSKFKFEFNKKGTPVRLFGILQDVTERKEAELALKILQQEILDQEVQEQKRVTRAMIIVQEKERNRLGEELHDNVNQILAGAKLYLGISGEDKSELRELIKYPIELIDSAIEEIRSLCHRLATPVKNIDLNQMVLDLLGMYGKNTTIKTKYNYSLVSSLVNDDLKLNIYRIIQEQINNIVKHAKAKNVEVSITEKGAMLDIVIKDDGVGFDTNIKRKGIGISNMMHRIESYNGEIAIISSPGNGCTIDIKIPC